MRGPGVTQEKGIIAWFAANHVAANLLMIMIIVGGLITVGTIRKETNPDLEFNMIQVRVPYLGAAPQEVEEGVILKIEDAIQDLVGIKKIRSSAVEGSGNVTLEVYADADLNQLLSDVKTRIDAISTFPALTEKPIIYKQERNRPVIMVALHGDLNRFGRNYEICQWAPSSYNGQPWRFVYAVRGSDAWDRLYGLLAEGNQRWAEDLRHLVLRCFDDAGEREEELAIGERVIRAASDDRGQQEGGALPLDEGTGAADCGDRVQHPGHVGLNHGPGSLGHGRV